MPRSSLLRACARLALVAALCAAGPTVARAQKLVLTADLDGSQAMPPSGSTATGHGTVIVDRETNTYFFAVTVSGLSSTELYAHVHGYAPPGQIGNILIGMGKGPIKIGTWTYPEGKEDEVLAGLTYMNSHTTNFPQEEIRGQVELDLAPDEGLFADLDQAQVVPPTGSAALGDGFFAIDPVANTVMFKLTYSGLVGSETGAEIHGPAPAGTNGPTLFTLPPGAAKRGVWNYPDANEADILDGSTYVLIRSSAFPGGEIRGQILPVGISTPYCTAKVNSQGCTPKIGSVGTPSAGAGPDTYLVTCSDVINNQPGLLFWGTLPGSSPILGGTLCLSAPAERTRARSSGGNPPPDDCSGHYAFRFTQAYMASKGLGAGDIVYCQWWTRDPAHPDGTGAGLSDALQFIIQP